MSRTVVPKVMAAAMTLCCAAATNVGCSRTVGGTVAAVSTSAETTRAPALASVPLVDLLLDATEFPPDYPAATLDATAAQGALAMVEGVPIGATVTPPDCTPAPPTEVAAVEGVHDVTTLRVVLARGAGPLRARRDQLERCRSFEAVSDTNGSWQVGVQMLPPPVLNVDEAFAIEQTQTGPSIFHSMTLLGQVGDIRVMAQLTALPGEPLDAVTLDAVFTSAVQKVRRAA